MHDVTQPAMTSDHGVVITVGIRVNGDRCAIVVPVATDNSTLSKKTLCDQAAQDFEAGLGDKIAACLSESAYLTYFQAVGMDDGFIPMRTDVGPLDYPGVLAAVCETSQVAALLIFYSDPDDLAAGARVKVGKTFLPGFPDELLNGDEIGSSLTIKLDLLAQAMAEGWTNAGTGGGKWYRVIAAPLKGSNGAALTRVGSWVTRGYSATQRRRLIPH